MHTSKQNPTKNILYLLFADVIWGTAYVAQRTGGILIGSYTFNCLRFLLGALVLLPVILIQKQLTKKPETVSGKQYIKGGAVCGIALAFASNFQQLGISLGSGVGKAGFLTSCYIVLVPIAGIPLGKKCSKNAAFGVVLALAGMYLLCMAGGDLTLCQADFFLLLCAFAYVLQILAIDHYAPMLDTIKMSCIEFFVCGLASFIMMLFFETGSYASFSQWLSTLETPAALFSIAYAGIFSCGIAFTLQIAGQRNFNPTIASLLMSLESVFSLIAGWILLKERMSSTEIAGCGLIFFAVITAQLPLKRKSDKD